MAKIPNEVIKSEEPSFGLIKQIKQNGVVVARYKMDPFNEYNQILTEKYEIAAMSESSLKKDWLKPEEDSAWKYL